MLVLIILGIFFLLSLWFSTVSLGFAGRICQIPRVSFGWRFLAILALTVFSVGLLIFFAGISSDIQTAGLLSLVYLGITLVSNWIFVSVVLRATLGRSLLVLILWMVFGAFYSTISVIGLKQYVVEAYVIPTNSMGPTLAGPHVQGACPHCGQSAMLPGYVNQVGKFSLTSPWLNADQPPPVVDCICFSCLRIGKTPPNNQPMESLDRLLVNKLLKPRRWDVMVFRYPREIAPNEPPRIYVQRLVGLPGEEVAIKQGAVWIDGVKLDPPESIHGLKYLSRHQMAEDFASLEEAVAKDDGMGREPVRLSPKGYFVLGDFTTRSSDSREWGEVPEENIIGVGSVIYWPTGRWRILR